VHWALRLVCFTTCLALLVANLGCGSSTSSTQQQSKSPQPQSDSSTSTQIQAANATVYYTNEDMVLGYSVQNDGTLQPLPNSPFRFTTEPSGAVSTLLFSPDNSLALVRQSFQFSAECHVLKRDSNTGVLTQSQTTTADITLAVFSGDGRFLITQESPNINVYRVDESSASISGPIVHVPVPSGGYTGQLIANPKRPFVYVYATQLVTGIEYFPVITAYEIHPDGTLTIVQPPQELHPGGNEGNAYDIAIERTGQYAIVTRNRAEIYVYRIGDDGSWTLISPDPVRPGVFVGYTYPSSSTDTVYVTNMFKQSPVMISYRLDSATGELERQGDISVGDTSEVFMGFLQQSSDGKFLYELDRDRTLYIFSLDAEGNIVSYKTQIVPGLL
jgi:hypothetical protein